MFWQSLSPRLYAKRIEREQQEAMHAVLDAQNALERAKHAHALALERQERLTNLLKMVKGVGNA